MLCVIVLGAMIYHSFSRDENEYDQVSYTKIKDWEKGKQADWSNKDSSVIGNFNSIMIKNFYNIS